jgi:TDG/mug DNA glycosylase family protein
VRETSDDAQGRMAEGHPKPGLRGFQARITWKGEEVLTLADIPPGEGGIVLIGINPSPVSVDLGHYYQGTLGRRLWSRLVSFGLLPNVGAAWEDERWQAAGKGLSDVVKRPTASASEVSAEELAAGAEALRAKLRDWEPSLVIFAFRASAEAVLGVAPSVGRGPAIDGVPTFRMEGPYPALTPVPARRYLAPATSEMEEGTVVRTRTVGLVGAMIPARLCCRMAMCVRMDAQVRVRP